MRRSIPVVAFLLFLAAVPLAAQITESMTVEVIEVPVYVSRQGRPVRGLAREDFTLTVNGQPQAIDYFDAIDRRTEDVGAPELNRRRMTMLLFDISHTQPWALRRAQKATTAFVAAASPNDSYAVATLTNRGITMLVPFTTDRTNVQRAVASLSVSRGGDAFGIATTAEERLQWSQEPIFDRRPDMWVDDSGPQRVDMRDMNADWLAARVDDQLRSAQHRTMTQQLEQLAQALRPLEGQKSVVLLSQGLAVADTMTDVMLWSDLMAMHKSFRTAGVILNAVDLTGLAGPWDPPANNQLFQLALDTGGYVQHDRNNILAALHDLEELESVVYILGFRPPANQKAGANSIRVKVRGAGPMHDVRYRRAYSPAKPAGEMNAVMLADVLLNDIPQNGVSVGARIDAAPETASITVSVPGPEVLAYIGDDQATADVFIYVFDKQNAVAGWGQKRINIQAGMARAHLEKHALRVAEVMKLSPGHYVAKVLVRVRGTEATGFTRTEFDVGS